ncbi:YHYH domain-containing protein [Hohaiivirga grylli]|uniref:YHYH domain-containing protein n=1 Tax=Hohaiivirga grylli TaxID=3133970 RepID=UPI00387E27DF
MFAVITVARSQVERRASVPIIVVADRDIMKQIAAIILSLIALTSIAAAHPGGLNSEGCHNNRKTGGYHCHR